MKTDLAVWPLIALAGCGSATTSFQARLSPADGGYVAPIDSGVDVDPDAGSSSVTGVRVADGGLLPCHYTTLSTPVDFLGVDLGVDVEQVFTIVNLGPADCLITDLALDPSSARAFSLRKGPIESQQLSAPGSDGRFPSSLLVPVDFMPTVRGDFSGVVVFKTNDPAAPEATVELTGSGGNYCLMIRGPDSFFVSLSGDPYCGVRQHPPSVENVCSSPAKIFSVVVLDGGPFSVGGLPMLPIVLYTDDRFQYQVNFNPHDAGSYIGQLLIQTNIHTGLGDGLVVLDLDGNATADCP